MKHWPENYLEYVAQVGAAKAVKTRLNEQWQHCSGGADLEGARECSRLLSYLALGNWDGLGQDPKALKLLSGVVREISPELKFSLG